MKGSGELVSTTKLLIEVETSHYDVRTPYDMIAMVRTALSFPAITSFRVIEAKSNHQSVGGPSGELKMVQL
jgi:hypothetical protein